MLRIEVPSLLRHLTRGEPELIAEGTNLRSLLASLEHRYPGLRSRFMQSSGSLSNMGNIYVNEVDFHDLAGLDTPLKDGDRVRLAAAPLISGGAL